MKQTLGNINNSINVHKSEPTIQESSETISKINVYDTDCNQLKLKATKDEKKNKNKKRKSSFNKIQKDSKKPNIEKSNSCMDPICLDSD